MLTATDSPEPLPLQGRGGVVVGARRRRESPRSSPGRTGPRFPRARRSPGSFAFYDEKVDIYVDGVRQERPRTKFS